MTYTYIASERQLKTLLFEIDNTIHSNNDDRFDVAIYSDNKDAKRVILIEFKKFTANYKENGEGITQLYKYAQRLKGSGINEIYLYLIAKIDDDFRSMLISSKEGFTRIFSQQGEVYHRSYNDVNAYIQVISPDALIADAKARNNILLSFDDANNNS